MRQGPCQPRTRCQWCQRFTLAVHSKVGSPALLSFELMLTTSLQGCLAAPFKLSIYGHLTALCSILSDNTIKLIAARASSQIPF